MERRRDGAAPKFALRDEDDDSETNDGERRSGDCSVTAQVLICATTVLLFVAATVVLTYQETHPFSPPPPPHPPPPPPSPAPSPPLTDRPLLRRDRPRLAPALNRVVRVDPETAFKRSRRAKEHRALRRWGLERVRDEGETGTRWI